MDEVKDFNRLYKYLNQLYHTCLFMENKYISVSSRWAAKWKKYLRVKHWCGFPERDSETWFYPFGVHPVALCISIPFKYTCDRNWEFIGVTFFSLFTTCFGPYGPSSGEIQLHHLHILRKPSILQRIRCFIICLLLSTLLYMQWQK
jgi:hypothetical protein